MVYDIVTVLPYATGDDRVSRTFVPDTATELTLLDTELTWTENADAEGIIFASARLNDISITDGDAFSTDEPRYPGTAGGAVGSGSTIRTAEVYGRSVIDPEYLVPLTSI